MTIPQRDFDSFRAPDDARKSHSMIPKELFVSYSSEDIRFTESLVAEIEARGVSCWFAKRDVLPGESYPMEITRAIEGCRALLLVFSEKANRSANENKHILREVEYAAGQRKTIYPVRISDVAPGEGLAYFLRTVQWIERDLWENRLAEKIVALVREAPDPVAPSSLTRLVQRLKRNWVAPVSVLAGGVILAAATVAVLDRTAPSPPAPVAPASVDTTPRPIVIEQRQDTPAEAARRNIQVAGYTLDNAGFFRAVAKGADVQEAFSAAGISGDEESLWNALMNTQPGSEAFHNLAAYTKNVASDHHAAKVRNEISGLLTEARLKQSSNGLRRAACETRPGVFIDKFVAKNLASACADAKQWTTKVLKFGSDLSMGFDQSNAFWWGYYAPQVLIYRPDRMRQLDAIQLAAAVSGRQPITGEVVQANVRATFLVVGNVIVKVAVFGGTANQAATVIGGSGTVDQFGVSACKSPIRNAFKVEEEARTARPLCALRLTFRADAAGNLTLTGAGGIEKITP